MKKISWRKILSKQNLQDIYNSRISNTEPNIEFHRKKDGVYDILVTHPNPTEEVEEQNLVPQEEEQPLNQQAPVQNTQAEPNNIQQSTSSLEDENVKIWQIKKQGALELVGMECDDCVGIAIRKNIEHGKSEIPLYENIKMAKLNKNGHSWRELIAEGVWSTLFDSLVN